MNSSDLGSDCDVLIFRLSLVIAAVNWAIRDEISALDHASDMMVFEVGNILQVLATFLYFFMNAIYVVSH